MLIELIVTFYMTTGSGQLLVDRHPARPQADAKTCERNAAAVLAAPREAGMRVTAYCLEK